MPNIEVTATAAVQPGVNGLKQLQSELGKTAVDAQKTDSSLAKMGSGLKSIAANSGIANTSLSSLGSTLLSGGVALGVSVVITGLIALGKELVSISKEQQRFNDVIDGAKSAYVKATLEVDKMRDAFAKAESGIITKESALKLYNSTVGKTIGQTNDLDIAEKNFLANADNYIKFTFLKAAANIALGKAAEAAFDAEAARFKTPERGILEGYVSREELKRRRIASALKEQAQFQAIYNNLIAEANKFSFAGIAQAEKEEKVIKKKTKAVKEYREEIERINPRVFSFLQDADPTRTTGQGVPVPVLVRPEFEIDPGAEQRIGEGLQDFLKRIKLEALVEDFNQRVAAAVEDIAENTAIGIGDAIGNALAGGQNVVPNLFGGLMENVGTQIQELGKFLIKSAITVEVAKKAFSKLLANPVAAVAVGIGLVALGALLKAQASKQFQGFASGGTVGESGFYNVGERGQERIFLPQGTKVQPNNEVMAYGGGGQVFIPAVTLSGSDLVISFNRASAQMGRNN